MRVLLVVPLLLVVAAPARAAGDAATAVAHFRNAQGQPVGEATLRDTPHGVLIALKLDHLPPGPHGFHVHQTGKCEPPFATAGGHFDPQGHKHGFAAPAGPHAGDLPNVVVGADGTASLEVMVPGVTLRSGEPGSLLDADGSALVVHAGPDDYVTDPAGNSGDRIACAVVTAR